MNRTLAAATVAGVVLSLTAGCSGDSGDATAHDETTLTVYAASSLTGAFEELGGDFEAEHDGVTVEFNFAGSSDLAAQIQEGAPADVFASADEANMDKLVADDLAATEPVLFAGNTLQIVVPADNPAGITSMEDLADPDVQVVLCAPEVPCGAASQELATLAGVSITPVSEEQKVTDVLAKVQTGEADAGLVYVTDVQSAGDAVSGIEVPEASSVVNLYPIAVVDGSEHVGLAQAFVDLVRSDEGQQVLADFGFAPAPD